MQYYKNCSCLCVLLLILFFSVNNCVTASGTTTKNNNEDLLKKLEYGLEITNKGALNINSEWSIHLYPSFLKSCAMHKSSWEILKLKFIVRILQTFQNKNNRETFIISFLGSSVTAGHDSHFNHSTPIVAGEYMQEAFRAMNVDIISRNVALGNNPCTPYDVCVKYFAGLDADIVHWEQTYFCWDSPIFEQFIRQALTSPSKPIVVFSQSDTAHWNVDKCKVQPPPHVLSEEEKDLLKSDPIKIVSELNKDELHKWSTLNSFHHKYKVAGLQTFSHNAHEKYACLGPYIKDWEKGAASWHPSVVAHRLRAAHHAYFWLNAWREAILDLTAALSKRSLEAVTKDYHNHLATIQNTQLGDLIHKTHAFVDDMKCYTDYEPRVVREVSLKDIAVAGYVGPDVHSSGEISPSSTAVGWKSIIYENLVSNSLVKKSLSMGYKDFKHLLYFASSEVVPLSLSFSMKKPGPVLLCQTPGIWGSLPKGFSNLWDEKLGPDVFISYDEPVPDKTKYVYQSGKATKLTVFFEKKLDICMQLYEVNAETPIREGQHVLTVVPKPGSKLIIAWLLTS